MQYLNVLLESLDDEKQAYFYGERLVIDVGSLQWCGLQKKIVMTFRFMDIIGFINRVPY